MDSINRQKMNLLLHKTELSTAPTNLTIPTPIKTDTPIPIKDKAIQIPTRM